MLFPSPVFFFLFLPLTLLGIYGIGRLGVDRLAPYWLIAASVFYYAWSNPAHLTLLFASILLNYSVGARLGPESPHRRRFLVLGITANLLLLGTFKYATFLVDTWEAISGAETSVGPILLPLAISFFTFQQIAYLVDAYRGGEHERSLPRYALFVSFFPRLAAGPIVRYREEVPQFTAPTFCRLRPEDLAVGLTLFAFGLFKKVVLADGIAPCADAVFGAARDGVSLTAAQAWSGAYAFAFQIYFDFSGYSDMAIGLGRLFGVRFAENFNSPYKATSIAEFWGRWNMTLSRFLRDYLYFPMYFSRRAGGPGAAPRSVALMVTMLAAGLWHGAGWNFVLWGGLLGSYMLVHDGWRTLRRRLGIEGSRGTWYGRTLAQALTFTAVVFSMVVFKADGIETAGRVLKSMVRVDAAWFPRRDSEKLAPVGPSTSAAAADLGPTLRSHSRRIDSRARLQAEFGGRGPALGIALLAFIVFFVPNTQEILARHRPTLYARPARARRWPSWEPSLGWSFVVAASAVAAILNLNRVTAFVYFRF